MEPKGNLCNEKNAKTSTKSLFVSKPPSWQFIEIKMANPARVTDIEQQLAHLRWKRIQNERKIRNGLNVTKSMKEKDTILQMSIDHAGEKAMWMTSVVRDELTRPLVLSDEEMFKLQRDEINIRDRYKRNAERQEMLTLRIKEDMRSRENNAFINPAAKNLKQMQIKYIEGRIIERKKEIELQVPIVHAKWSGHNEDIRRQQRERKQVTRRDL